MKIGSFGLFLLIASLVLHGECATSNYPLVSVRLSGGIGNQMFQVAAAYAYALDIGGKVILPNETIEHVGSSPIFQKLERFEGHVLPNAERIQELSNMQYTELPKKRGSIHLEGYFFSAKYFDHRRKEILELFAPRVEIKEKLIWHYHDLLSQDTVAVHVRRGDYQTTLQDGDRLLCDLLEDTDYYEKALLHFDTENQHFVIFSDDIEAMKQVALFKGLKHVTFIEGLQAHEDLYLMSMCKNQIMANSTFSWWASYLREDPNAKVTYPIHAFWGPAVTKRALSESGYWGPPIPKKCYDAHGICCKGPDYLPLDSWIKVK